MGTPACGDGERALGQEVVHNFHVPTEAEFAVLLPAEFAHRDDGIDVPQLMFQVSRMSPQLRRPVVGEGASHAFPALTELPLVSPKDVRGTHQPMIVSHVQLNRIAICQYAGPPYERNIVIVDDVKPSLVEKTPHRTAIQDGQAGL